MATEWLKSFIDSLERLLDKPPYFIYVFIGAIFVVVSLITRFDSERSWIFLIYAVGGMIWRYAEKDLVRPLKEKFKGSEFWIRTVYHLGNFGLFFSLLYYLRII